MSIVCEQIQDGIPSLPLDTLKQPWVSSPYALISWWDMENFSATAFFRIATQLTILASACNQDQAAGKRILLLPEQKQIFLDAVIEIKERCAELGLKVSQRSAGYLINLMNQPDTIFSGLGSDIGNLRSSILWEMDEIRFFHMPSKQEEFYDQKELFGATVNAKFPSVQFDMVESGNCFAMGRGTACVFHLMRIMEVGVQQFGAKLGVTLVNEKNWQNILDEINRAIKALLAKAPGTVEMSQASANLYSVKLAWRNEVMHPNDTYTLEEAENLIRQVKLFMGQLAKIV
ncbi:MAG: hypothetical protein ABR976_17295 [Terracidiphilus sp.]